MLVLDTNHLTELDRNSAAGQQLAQRLRSSGKEAVTTIVNVEEQLRGWLALINRHRYPFRQIDPYGRLLNRVHFFTKWHLLPWDTPAARELQALKAARIRIGTMDLKIASIVLANGAMLLTRNLSDFSRVPGLQVEDWL